MNWSKKILWLLTITCCSISCEREIEITVAENEPKLVLHAYVATGEKFHMTIGKTVLIHSVVNGDEAVVTNAWALLYENDVFADSLRYDDLKKEYISAIAIAAPGKTYKVIAGADGFKTVEAIAKSAMPVNTVSVIHEKQARSNSAGELLDDVVFSFNDAAGEKNFYLAALYPGDWVPWGLGCVYSNDPAVDRFLGTVLPFEEGACFDNERILFSDRSFDGSLKQVSISGNSNALATQTDTLGNLHRPYLKRYVISEEHYNYLKAIWSMNLGDIVPTLNDPVAVKGNVKNGYGIVSVFPVTTDTLR
jgi:hypothetical protein